MPINLTRSPHQPTNPLLLNSFYILRSTHTAVSSFLDIFRNTRSARGARGTPTDEEQDLLRAMLVFGSSGLDSTVKQLIRDTLGNVIDRDAGAAEMFKSHIEKRIRKGEEPNYRFLAGVIAITLRGLL